jgi:hypothetical protein
VHRRRSGNCPVGGTMLKIIISILLVIAALPAFGCWNLQGSYAIDGETYQFANKVDPNKDYLFPAGAFHIKLRLVQHEKKETITLFYEIQERKASKLVLVTKGEEEDILLLRQTDVFAKGELGQPNSILTLKLTHI